MFHRILAITIFTSISTVATITLAQLDLNPSSDRNGDYNSIQRKNPDGTIINGTRGEHRSWRIVATSLNCRSNPGINNRIIRRFAKDQLIQSASIGRGGADEVIVVQRDTNGKPWMRVNLDPGQCFVRANSQFIEPNSLE